MYIKGGADFRRILRGLKGPDAAYVIKWKLVNAVDCNLPQQRKRVLIIGVLKKHLRSEFRFPAPQPLHLQVSDLLEPGIHPTCELTPYDKSKVAAWRLKLQSQGIVLDRHDFVFNLAPSMDYGRPILGCSPCITTNCSRFYLVRQQRMLSLVELLRLQGFQEPILWPESIPMTVRYGMVGSSIPINMLLSVFEVLLPCVSFQKPVPFKTERHWDGVAAKDPMEDRGSADADAEADADTLDPGTLRILATGEDRDRATCYFLHVEGTPRAEADWIREEGLDPEFIAQFRGVPHITDACYLCGDERRTGPSGWQCCCAVCHRAYHSACLAEQGIRLDKCKVDGAWACPLCQAAGGAVDGTPYGCVKRLLAKGKDRDGAWCYLTEFEGAEAGEEEWLRPTSPQDYPKIHPRSLQDSRNIPPRSPQDPPKNPGRRRFLRG